MFNVPYDRLRWLKHGAHCDHTTSTRPGLFVNSKYTKKWATVNYDRPGTPQSALYFDFTNRPGRAEMVRAGRRLPFPHFPLTTRRATQYDATRRNE
ncbi:hypothetical protein J6590_027079 [Homalodisca vitripennis]|nr:hypothetical protein J6590_027079 [Homalodisca vitripennis]